MGAQNSIYCFVFLFREYSTHSWCIQQGRARRTTISCPFRRIRALIWPRSVDSGFLHTKQCQTNCGIIPDISVRTYLQAHQMLM
jgi:hypothetical protein